MVPGEDSRIGTVLAAVLSAAPHSYLVGGFVRDHLIGLSSCADLDIAIGIEDGFEVAFGIARSLGKEAAFVPLDRERGTARIVLRGEEPITLDLSTYKGAGIEEDLFCRDFTINAVAVSVKDFLQSDFREILDPTGGVADIKAGVVRVCSENTFADDPLRILRAFRFSASLGFDIVPETLEAIPRHLSSLAGVSSERVRDEVTAILAAKSSLRALKGMDRWGVMDLLFPEFRPMKGCGQNDYHHLDVWGHTLETVERMETLMAEGMGAFGALEEEIAAYLAEEPVLGRPRSVLLKLAALYHDVGKPSSATIDPNGRVRFFGHEKISRQIFEERGEVLKLSTREIRMVGEWIGGHMRPMIATGGPLSRRALHRLLSTFRREIFGLSILFLSDLAASRGPARRADEDTRAPAGVLQALQRWHELEQSPETPLLNGRDLIATFGLKEGPYLGSVLRRLSDLQGSGEIATKEEALVAARNMILNGGDQ